MIARSLTLVGVACACALCLFTAPAWAGEHYFQDSFGSAGAGAGELELETVSYLSDLPDSGLAVDDETHDVYVADTGNHRIDEFESDGTFVRAWGWGVADGLSKFETCGSGAFPPTANCQAGISGSEPGEFESAVFIAVDNDPSSPSHGDVYIGDSKDNLVTKFTAEGELIEGWGNNGPGESPDGQLNGSPSEHFNPLGGVGVGSTGVLYADNVPYDQLGSVFTFEQSGSFASAFSPEYVVGPTGGLAVDAAGNSVLPDGVPNGGADLAGVYGPSGFQLGLIGYVHANPTGFALNPINDDFYNDHEGVLIEHYESGGPESHCPLEHEEDSACTATDSFGSGDIDAGAGLAVNPAEETVYVADAGARRVEVFSLVGPLDVTDSATGVTGADATLNGHVAPTGGEPAEECRFEYVEAAKYHPGAADPYAEGTTVACSPSSPYSKATSVSAAVAGLSVSTVYHFRVAAKDAKGTNFGLDETFRTHGVEIGPEWSIDVSATSVTLAATINPHEEAATYHFEYLTEAAYLANGGSFSGPQSAVSVPQPDAVLESADEGVEVSFHVQGLSPKMVYYYRVRATAEFDGQSLVSEGPGHTFTTQGGGSFTLPDGRQWEMVTPPSKNGALFLPLGTSFIEIFTSQAAAAGNAIVDLASQPVENQAQGATLFDQVLSTRGPSGWSSQTLGRPYTKAPGITIGKGGEFRYFSEDLSQAAVQELGRTSLLSPEASEATPYLRTNYLNGDVTAHCTSSCFTPLVTKANTAPGTVFGGEVEGNCLVSACGPSFLEATPDARHVLVGSGVPLTAGGGGEYEWSAGKPPGEQLQPVAVLPKGEGGNVVSAEAHLSPDGSYIFSYNDHLYIHDLALSESFRLDIARGVAEPANGDVDVLYESKDGSLVLFGDSEQLTSAAGGGVYECFVAEVDGRPACARLALTDLEAPPTTPGAKEIGGPFAKDALIDSSADGSYLYFHESNKLYVDHYDGSEWKQTLIAALVGGNRKKGSGDSSDWAPILGERTLRVSPNGEWLAFMSELPLTGYDNHDVVTGLPDKEVFEYNATTGRLTCASCDPTGARPYGTPYQGYVSLVGAETVWPEGAPLAADIPPWTRIDADGSAVYQSRYLSDSGRLFFNSHEGLVPDDVNGQWDVYEYEPEGAGGCTSAVSSGSDVFRPGRSFEMEGARAEEGSGCVGLISSGTSPEESAFLDASETGGDVFFLTQAKLVPQDVDTALDVYDAHECSSESPCLSQLSEPPACTNEASCKPSPTPQPSVYGLPSSATFSGPGDSAPPPPAKAVTKKMVKCKPGSVKNRKGRCVREKPRRRKAKAKKSTDRKGSR
jgi:hypothetical protein